MRLREKKGAYCVSLLGPSSLLRFPSLYAPFVSLRRIGDNIGVFLSRRVTLLWSLVKIDYFKRVSHTRLLEFLPFLSGAKLRIQGTTLGALYADLFS